MQSLGGAVIFLLQYKMVDTIPSTSFNKIDIRTLVFIDTLILFKIQFMDYPHCHLFYKTIPELQILI